MAAKTVFRYLPKSFFNFVLIGFGLVALPLLVALTNDAIYIDRLFVQSQQAIYRAVQATHASGKLVEQITAMERNARQFAVLGDKNLLDSYTDRHLLFQQTAEELSQLVQQDLLRGQLEALTTKEQYLFGLLQNGEKGALTSKETEAEFISLTPLAQSIMQESSNAIDDQVDVMRQMAADTKQNLVWQALWVVPGVILFTVVFTVLISRPFRQIDKAIRRMGDGEFSQKIVVNGPRDLQYLGEQLDWLRRRLAELEERKGGFLRNVSHDLKTPLAAIREGSELLADGVVGGLNSQQQEVASIVRKNSVELQKMIENLLNFSLAKKRDLASYITEFGLRALIETVIANHKPAILAKNIELELNCVEFIVVGDEEKIRVVIDNLLSNAVKYSPNRAKIRISAQQEIEHLIVDVQDNGPGVEADDADKVFEPFYRGKSTEQGHIKGSGLGLSIVRDFVKDHGGVIELVTAEVGAHFRVKLPKLQTKN